MRENDNQIVTTSNRNPPSNIATTRQRTVRGVTCTIRAHTMAETNADASGNCELDLHADTCALGINCIPLLYTGKTYNITPFSPEYEAMVDIPIISCEDI